MRIFDEFREFAIKGNVVDMAVGIIIGGAFGAIARSLVDDVIMPPIGLLTRNVDMEDVFIVLKEGAEKPPPYDTISAAQEAGAVTVNIGIFLNHLFTFLIVAWAVFILVKAINSLRREEEKKAPPPPTPPREEELLTEIRDILKENRG